jgi:LuxR family maltose regulon positive regulatory protein
MLLSPKLSPPHLPTSLVERSRLLEELDMVCSQPLTLISASAGSGKTTLLSAWVAAFSHRWTVFADNGRVPEAMTSYATAPLPFAWLSLEEMDNDPILFWTSVIAALRTCLPKLGETALAMLHAPQFPPLSTILAALLCEIREEGRELILILDDYHVISDQAIHESMLFLLDHLPPILHLVLATRIDPALPLSRLRVRGQLLEIRDQDLRFSWEETARFLLEGMGLPLSLEDVTMLEKRTEGWIAGLQLAALSLRKSKDVSAFVKDFAGSHRFVLDYVQQEILAGLSNTLQDFVLQTAILTRMDARLCQAVTAMPTQEQCQQMLERLERANLFVVPLDAKRQWYRFHDLFREVLLVRLQTRAPDLVPLLHQRAARWYESVGELREAIMHSLAALDYSFAANLMEQAAPLFWLNGEGRAVQNWVLSLPDTLLCMHTGLALNAVLRLDNSINLSNETLYVSLRAQMERTCTRMEGILHRKLELSLGDTEVALIERRLRMLRALGEARAALKRGDKEHLHLLSQEIGVLPREEEANWSIIPLTFAFWLNVYLQGEGATLIPRLLEARPKIREARDHLVTIRVSTMLAHAYTKAAQWHQAQQECLETCSLIAQIGMHTIWSGYIYYNLLIASYAQNRLEEASDWLKLLLRAAQDWQQVELLVRGEFWSAQLALVRGDLQAAHQILHKLEALVELEGYAYHAPLVVSLRVQCWLAQGMLAQASDWVVQTAFHPDAWNPLRKGEFLMLVRVYLAQQQYARAGEMLEQFSKHLDQPGDLPTALEWMTLYVVAMHHGGKGEQVRSVAARLFALTEPGGSIRVYLDAGLPMKQVLLTLLSTSRDDLCAASLSRSYVSQLLVAFEQERSGALNPAIPADTPLVSQQESQPAPTASEVQRQLVEPLSRQELKVLPLLVAGQTYAEMAETLMVSPHTVKTQVSSIYRKLGVSRRAQAIDVTRQLHLL